MVRILAKGKQYMASSKELDAFRGYMEYDQVENHFTENLGDRASVFFPDFRSVYDNDFYDSDEMLKKDNNVFQAISDGAKYVWENMQAGAKDLGHIVNKVWGRILEAVGIVIEGLSKGKFRGENQKGNASIAATSIDEAEENLSLVDAILNGSATEDQLMGAMERLDKKRPQTEYDTKLGYAISNLIENDELSEIDRKSLEEMKESYIKIAKKSTQSQIKGVGRRLQEKGRSISKGPVGKHTTALQNRRLDTKRDRG